MKNLRLTTKGVVALMASTLLLGGAIGGTMAWLTDSTDEVTNTFTIGDITLELTEHKYENGTLSDSETTDSNEYKFVPGATLPKDPYVIVGANSESCYIFVEVTETVPAGLPEDFFTEIIPKSGWVKLEDEDVYYYGVAATGDTAAACNEIPTDTTDQTIEFMESVTITPDVTKEDMKDLATKPTLSFKAYAIQSENLGKTDPAEIWKLVKDTESTESESVATDSDDNDLIDF